MKVYPDFTRIPFDDPAAPAAPVRPAMEAAPWLTQSRLP